jgi:hypothetical protein
MHRQARRTPFIAAFLAIIAIAVAVRSYNIGSQSLWTDELFSRYYPDLFSLKFLWTTGLFHENSPPLYYMALKAWMRLFGTSATAMRSLSLLASVLTLPPIYLLAVELFDRHRALLAMLLFALLPMQIGYAQEVRTYSLLLIPIAATLLAVARILRDDVRWRTLGLYGVAAIVALYCHATAAFFVAACNIVVLTYIAVERKGSTLGHWIAINTLVFLFSLPELAAMLVQGKAGSGIDWIPPFHPIDIVRALGPIVVGNATPDKFPGAELSLLLVAAIAAGLLVSPRPRRTWLVLLAIPLAFVLLIGVVSQLHSIFIARVFCWLDIPLAILLADVIATPWSLRPVAACITFATLGVGLGYQQTVPRNEPWRDLFDQIGPGLARGNGIVLAPLTDPTTVAYYAPNVASPQMLDTGPHNTIENNALPNRLHVRWISPTQLFKEISAGANVWLVMRPPDQPYVRSLLAQLPAPTQRIDRSCDKVVCITALAWSSRLALTRQ